MATTQTRPYITGNDSIKLEYGVPQIACFKWLEGKSVPSQFGERAMFTAIDSRKLFVDGEDASDIERGMRVLAIRPGEDFVRLTKVRHARGGGHSIRVERVAEPADDAPAWVRGAAPAPRQSREEARAAVPTREEALLEKSIELARERGAAAFQRTPSRVSPEPPPAPAVAQNGRIHDTAAPAEPASAAGSMSKLLTGALVASIKGYLEAVELAKAQGIPCSIAPLEFTAEDIRQSATSMLIEYWRSGGTR